MTCRDNRAVNLRDLRTLIESNRIGGRLATRSGVINMPASEDSLRVTGVDFDSRKVQAGSVYVAVRGQKSDGHDFLQAAVQRGASVLVLQEDQSAVDRVPDDFRGPVFEVPATRAALAPIAARFFGEPSSRLFTVGVTGTNGKTTTTHLIEQVLNHAAMPTGVIGTIDHHFGLKVWKSEMTTPDPVAFQSRLKEFVDLGARAVALEASSHALDQNRVDAVEFDVAVFSNLTRDHLDYHGTMENYFLSKSRLFTQLLRDSKKSRKTAILFADDAWSDRLEKALRGLSVDIVTFGETRGQLRYQVASQTFAGSEVELSTGEKFLVPMPGRHNVQNAIAALLVGRAAGVRLSLGAEALKGRVPGRLERVPNSKGLFVFVDYAHTDDALKSILASLDRVRSTMSPRPRIITVFGCGGDRDRGKRPLMREAALSHSDRVIVTSDNPRSENPESIIDDVLAGASAAALAKLSREVDRRKAIHLALAAARPGDVVLIAGKGHENTQTIGERVLPFLDSAVALEYFSTGSKE